MGMLAEYEWIGARSVEFGWLTQAYSEAGRGRRPNPNPPEVPNPNSCVWLHFFFIFLIFIIFLHTLSTSDQMNKCLHLFIVYSSSPKIKKNFLIIKTSYF